jgi:hypothetical protein
LLLVKLCRSGERRGRTRKTKEENKEENEVEEKRGKVEYKKRKMAR